MEEVPYWTRPSWGRDLVNKKKKRALAETRERNLLIVKMRADGSSYKEIGNIFKLTREQVHQIILWGQCSNTNLGGV